MSKMIWLYNSAERVPSYYAVSIAVLLSFCTALSIPLRNCSTLCGLFPYKNENRTPTGCKNKSRLQFRHGIVVGFYPSRHCYIC